VRDRLGDRYRVDGAGSGQLRWSSEDDLHGVLVGDARPVVTVDAGIVGYPKLGSAAMTLRTVRGWSRWTLSPPAMPMKAKVDRAGGPGGFFARSAGGGRDRAESSVLIEAGPTAALELVQVGVRATPPAGSSGDHLHGVPVQEVRPVAILDIVTADRPDVADAGLGDVHRGNRAGGGLGVVIMVARASPLSWSGAGGQRGRDAGPVGPSPGTSMAPGSGPGRWSSERRGERGDRPANRHKG